MKKNHKLKRFLSVWMLVMFISNLFIPTMVLASQSGGPEATIEISVERRVLGQEDILKTTNEVIIPGEKGAVSVDRILKKNNIHYEFTGSIENNFYMSAIETPEGELLEEFGHGLVSGWMYYVNGQKPDIGLSDYEFKPGDKVRIQYTAKDMGQDILVVNTIYSIREKLAEAEGITQDNYTDESFNNLQAEIVKVKGKLPTNEEIGAMMSVELGEGNCDTITYGKTMESLLKDLENAIDSLEEKPLDPEVPTVTPEFDINLNKNWDKVDFSDGVTEQPNIVYIEEGKQSIGAKVIMLSAKNAPVIFNDKEIPIVDGSAIIELTPGIHSLSTKQWGRTDERTIVCKTLPYTITGNLVPGGTVTIDFKGEIEEGIKDGKRKLKETNLEFNTNIPGLKKVTSKILEGGVIDRDELSKVTFTIPKDTEPGIYELNQGGVVQSWSGESFGSDGQKGKFSVLPNITIDVEEKVDLSKAYDVELSKWSTFDKVYTLDETALVTLNGVAETSEVIVNGQIIYPIDSVYAVELNQGDNSIVVDGQESKLFCKKITYSIPNKNRIVPGSKVTVQFDGLEKAFDNIPGLHNSYKAKTTFKSNVSGLEIVTSEEAGSLAAVNEEILNKIEFVIPDETVPGEYELFDGSIYQAWHGSSIFDEMEKNFSIIPKVKFQVRDSIPEDTVEPIITTTLKENIEVSREKLFFKATATDDVDGDLKVTAKLNDEEVHETSKGQYNVILDEGINKIEISAIDAAGNVGFKEYLVTFKPNLREGASIILDSLSLDLKTGDTHQIIAVDSPDSRSNETDDTLKMTYTVVSGSEVVKVNKNGLVTALKPGFGEISVKYSGLTTPAIVQVQVRADDVENEPKITTSIKETKYDILYYTGESYDYTFTVEAENSKVKVKVNDKVISPIDGVYCVSLKEGYNPIRIEAEGNGAVSYKNYNIRAKKAQVIIENISNPGQDIFQGDKVKISFKGLETPIPKYLRVYNPKRTRVEYLTNMPGANNIYGKPTQYDLPTNNAIEFTASSSGIFNFTGGNIEEAWWGDELYSERDISGDGPNMSAVVRQGNFSTLPDFTIEVKENKDYVNNYMVEILNDNPIKAGDEVTLKINNLEMPETDSGTVLQALTIFNTDIEGLKEIKSDDAAKDESKLQTIRFKIPEGTKAGTYTITNGRVFKEWQPGVLYVDSEFYKGELPEIKLVVTGDEEIPVPPLDTTTPVEVVKPSMTVDEAINHAIKWTMKNVKNPTFENEWDILGLVRSGMFDNEEYLDTYYNNVVKVVKDKKGILTRNKYTEYSRTIIALTALGKDPRDVGGYDLVEKLYDFDKISRQGVNGVIFALIALDTKDFEIPKDAKNSREKMIQYIIDSQLKDGGFTLMGSEGNVDVTGMAIQALSNYKDQPQVNEAIDKAVNFLSKVQLSDGGYESDGVKNIEASVQTLVGLTALGIEPRSEGFVKEKNWIIADMMNFAAPNSGFMHSLDQGVANDMATEQALYGLVSYKRFTNHQTSLYDMSDVALDDDSDNGNNGGDDGNGGEDNGNGDNNGDNGSSEGSGNNGSGNEGSSGSGNQGGSSSNNNGENNTGNNGNQSGNGSTNGNSNNGSSNPNNADKNVTLNEKDASKDKEPNKDINKNEVANEETSNKENQCNHDESYNTTSGKQPLTNVQVVFLTLAAVFVVSAIKEVIMMQIKKKKQRIES